MTSCPAHWYTTREDSDGEGEAEHFCFLGEEEHDWHVCASHLCCFPVADPPAWAARWSRADADDS